MSTYGAIAQGGVRPANRTRQDKIQKKEKKKEEKRLIAKTFV
jgi:hypothetical protein